MSNVVEPAEWNLIIDNDVTILYWDEDGQTQRISAYSKAVSHKLSSIPDDYTWNKPNLRYISSDKLTMLLEFEPEIIDDCLMPWSYSWLILNKYDSGSKINMVGYFRPMQLLSEQGGFYDPFKHILNDSWSNSSDDITTEMDFSIYNHHSLLAMLDKVKLLDWYERETIRLMGGDIDFHDIEIQKQLLGNYAFDLDFGKEVLEFGSILNKEKTIHETNKESVFKKFHRIINEVQSA